MNEAEHTFPIPENVAHQLDEIEDELLHHRLRLKVHNLAKASPWRAVGISALAGLALGVWFRRYR